MAKAKKETLSLEELLEQAIVKEEDRPYVVSENWVWTRIGALTQIIGGGTPSSSVAEYYEGGEIPWITPADLSGYQDIYISKGKRNITQMGLAKSSARLMPKDTVLLSSRAPIGYVAISENELCTNQGFKSFLPSRAYLPKYLLYYLKSIKHILESYSSGTTFLELSGNKAGLVEIPLPPLEEQQRIVEVIESLFEKLDTAKELVQNALDSFESRKAAILHKAFSGELTSRWREENGVRLEDWEEKNLKSLCKISSGGTPSRTNMEYYNGSIPWVKTGEINWNYINVSEEKITENAVKESSAKLFPAGTVLVAMYGQGLTRGRAAILDIEATTNQAVCALMPNSELLNKYLYYYFMSNYWSLREKAVGGNQPNFSGTIIGGFVISKPPVEEQREIVNILDNLLEKEQHAKELCDVIEKINLMKKAILARAFRGELGTNDPEEESAVELLKEVLKDKI